MTRRYELSSGPLSWARSEIAGGRLPGNIRRTGTRNSLRNVNHHRAALPWTTDSRRYSHGEVEIAGDDIRGIAVHITSRVATLGGRDDIVVSRTIKDIVAGSGITFEDFGIHVLKGIPDDWQLYRVADLAGADAASRHPAYSERLIGSSIDSLCLGRKECSSISAV